MENIDDYKTEQLLEQFDKTSETVDKAYKIFEDVYKSAFEKTYVSDIVNGESISIKDENILINNVDMTKDKINFDKRLHSCSKRLYDYQIKAIRQLIELEQNGYYVNPKTLNKIVSNGWILSLPIGSGKSIVFLFLALWYRNVPSHPIIVSKSGKNIPIYEQVQFKYYPWYYEDCCYIEKPYIKNENGEYILLTPDMKQTNSSQIDDNDIVYMSDDNCVVLYENYTQNQQTIILTHGHLLEQMRRYIIEDFPAFAKGKGTNINICRSAQEIKPTDNIVILPANENNVRILVEMSHDKPFMRVIIDDYTSMGGIDTFRQILSSSTIFVSGSGFERSQDLIPVSYYTLKYSPFENIRLVGLPEDTYKGVVRNNIAMIKLLGSACDFSDYDFVQRVDERVMSLYSTTSGQIYPYLATNSIKDYLGLYFVLLNRDKLRNAINAIDKDYNITGKYPHAKYINQKHEIKHFIEWVKELDKIKQNKLLLDLMSLSNSRTTNSESTPLVQQVCMCCKKTFLEHNGYGIVMSCCGAFYCENCIKNATTHVITNKYTNEYYEDKNNYYCCCCRRRNPTSLLNMTKKKDKAIYAYNIVKNYFMNESIKDSIKFDYYFYMLIHGLTPTKHEGIPINIQSEIERGLISQDIFKQLNKQSSQQIIPQIQTIFSMDHLMIKSIDSINRSLIMANQTFDYIPYILFYNAPKYMESRIQDYITNYDRYVRTNSKQKQTNPITKIKPIFMDSVEGLIGIHINVIAIIVFDFKATTKDGVKQLLGRCLRINTFNNKITFFITPDVISFS